MATTESPAAARRRVRLAVRQAREAASLTQAQVAEAMEWSQSKVMRIESGEVTVAPNDLRPLLAYLGITDPRAVDELVQDAKVSRRRQAWWADPRYRDHMTPAMRQVIQYETEATAIRHFSTTVLPGPLQTREYAEAVLTTYGNELPASEIEVRLESRMRRREEMLARKDRLELFLLLDESVVRRQVGGPEVTGAQLADLSRLGQQRRLMMRVVPFTVNAPLPLYGSYEIYNFSAELGNAVLYRESHLTDEIVEYPPEVTRHRALFDRLWDAALDEVASTELVQASAKAILEEHRAGSSGQAKKADAPARRRSPRGG
jgi:transcriptional regulator with XRE-family HTH domain